MSGYAILFSFPVVAQEAFAGLYAHGVGTPLSLDTGEGGTDLAVGYRLASPEELTFIASPEPYIIGALNSGGGSSFAGAGLSWKLRMGPLYVRPAVGLVVHDGSSYRVAPGTPKRSDLGSRVLLEPEIGLGYQLSERISVEASWMHISHAQLFNSKQNPGLDMIGVRLNVQQ
jgi:hypothetical protein